jgi:carbonic anhydrase
MTVRVRVAALLLLLLSSGARAAGTDPSAPRTPQEVLGVLKAGNDRFARNASSPVSLSGNRRRELADAEHPIAIVLSCADSRVPPEFVFNAGLGDLLVVRTAGGVVDRSILATVEYGAEQLRIPLLVVMGHESCSAVKAAAESKSSAPSANLDYLIKAIQAARKPSAPERDEIKMHVLANVEQVINDAMAKSPLLRRLVDEGKLAVVGAYYELVSGRVMFSAPVTAQSLPPQTANLPSHAPKH